MHRAAVKTTWRCGVCRDQTLRAGTFKCICHRVSGSHDFKCTPRMFLQRGPKQNTTSSALRLFHFQHLGGIASVRARRVYLHPAIWAIHTWWTRSTISHLGVSSFRSPHSGDIVDSPASAGVQVVSHCGQTHSCAILHIERHLLQHLYLNAVHPQSCPLWDRSNRSIIFHGNPIRF